MGIASTPLFSRSIIKAKKLWYGDRGEPIQYGQHRLRYLPGTRPVRLKYIDSPHATVRNDVRQINFILEKVRPNDFVLDIGGHFGQYAVLFSSLVGHSGRLIIFEPDPGARKILLRNLALNGFADRVEIEAVAIFDQNGEHSFFSLGADSMSSLVRSGLGANAGSPNLVEFRVQTSSLDDYLTARGLPAPALVKLDAEGAEINILRGARQLMRSRTIILCELHPYAWKEFGTTFDELLNLVSESAKNIRYLDPSLSIHDGAFYGAVVIH